MNATPVVKGTFCPSVSVAVCKIKIASFVKKGDRGISPKSAVGALSIENERRHSEGMITDPSCNSQASELLSGSPA